MKTKIVAALIVTAYLWIMYTILFGAGKTTRLDVVWAVGITIVIGGAFGSAYLADKRRG